MTELLRNKGSLTSASITRTRSPAYDRCSSGKECLRKQGTMHEKETPIPHNAGARAKSSEGRGRSLNARTNFLGKHLLSPTVSGFRPRSSEKQDSSRRNHQTSYSQDIPLIIVNDVSTSLDRNDYSYTNMNTPRSRSPSPFDWIERERLPSGSPTFEQVMCDMLSDTEISPKSSDEELSGDGTGYSKRKSLKCNSKTVQKNLYRKPRSKNKI